MVSSCPGAAEWEKGEYWRHRWRESGEYRCVGTALEEGRRRARAAGMLATAYHAGFHLPVAEVRRHARRVDPVVGINIINYGIEGEQLGHRCQQ